MYRKIRQAATFITTFMHSEKLNSFFRILIAHSMDYWKKNLYILWATQLLAMIGLNLIIPFLPFYIRDLGVQDESSLAQWSGLIFAAPFLTAVIATPLWGVLGDRYGKKLMVIRAIFGLGLSQILVGFSQDVTQLLIFRLLQGTISGYISATLALVSISTPREKIGYALGFLQSATAAGTMLGPPVGGFLADIMDYHYIFFLVAGMCIIGGFVVMKFVREAPQQEQNGKRASVRDNIRYMAGNKQLRLVAIGIVLGQAAALMIEPIFALFIEQFRMETPYLTTIVGIIFSVSGIFMVISAPWWGRRNDRLGPKKNLTLSLTCTGIAYGLHIIVPNLISLGFLRAGLGFARGGILHTFFSLVNLHAPSDRKSGLMGIASSLAILGNSLGPIMGGWIAGSFGIRAVFGVNSLLFLAMSFVILRLLEDVRSVPDEKVMETLAEQEAEE